jgi:hypothetical protein
VMRRRAGDPPPEIAGWSSVEAPAAPDAWVPDGQPATNKPVRGRYTMPDEAPGPVADRWCDVAGRHISLFCWVEQVRESPQFGALFPRLHQQGQVLGRGPDVLYVRFEGEGQLIGVAPQLVRLLPYAPGRD